MPTAAGVPPISIGIIGDEGGTSNSLMTCERLCASRSNLVVWLGGLSCSDMRYANGITKASKHTTIAARLPNGLNRQTSFGT